MTPADLKAQLERVLDESHGQPIMCGVMENVWPLILAALTERESSLLRELDEWRGYAGFLAVHGIAPPRALAAQETPHE